MQDGRLSIERVSKLCFKPMNEGIERLARQRGSGVGPNPFDQGFAVNSAMGLQRKAADELFDLASRPQRHGRTYLEDLETTQKADHNSYA